MSEQRLLLDFKGLVTAPGQLGEPPGSLLTAMNVDFPAPGLASKRRGLKVASQGLGEACWSAITSKQLGSNVLFNTGSSTQALHLQYTDGSAPFTSVTAPDASTIVNAPDRRMKFAVSLKNHFLTSSRAAGRLESNLLFQWAGMSRPKGFYEPVHQLVAGSWLAAGSGVAYRVVFGTVDADGVTRLSPASGRTTLSNIATTTGYTAAARATLFRVLIPFQSDTTTTAVTTSYFVQVYRSIQSVVATAQPNDELQLCYQANLTAPQIAAGYIDITDTCPEAALGACLYTNTVSGGDVSTGFVAPVAPGRGIGIVANNDRPPVAKDVASYGDCLWWANFTTPYREIVSLLAVGAGGLAVGDVLNIGGVNFTGVAGAPASPLQFKVELGLASTALNIRATALNICSAINAEPTQTQVTATYIGSDASPGTIGQMLFENRRSDGATFALSTSGVTTAFLPDLATATATQDTWGNGLAISKPFQGDAVPSANYVRVGRNDTVIQRVIPLRDALFILTDDGIYWARGSRPSDFVIDTFDPTFRLANRDAVVTCGDAIYAWGLEGIARITNGGVEYLDLPIRNYVQEAQDGLEAGVTPSAFAQRAFAVAYRVQRKVIFFFPGGREVGNYACAYALVFHIPTGAWSTYFFAAATGSTDCGKLSGAVRWSDEVLYLGEWRNGSASNLYYERHAGDVSDYADTTPTTADQPIDTVLWWQTVVPSPAQLSHWTELHIWYSPPDESVLGLPTAVNVQCGTETGLTMTATISSIPNMQSRVIIASNCGISARLTVLVQHNTALDYFASSGFGILYHPVSNFTVR